MSDVMTFLISPILWSVNSAVFWLHFLSVSWEEASGGWGVCGEGGQGQKQTQPPAGGGRGGWGATPSPSGHKGYPARSAISLSTIWWVGGGGIRALYSSKKSLSFPLPGGRNHSKDQRGRISPKYTHKRLSGKKKNLLDRENPLYLNDEEYIAMLGREGW